MGKRNIKKTNSVMSDNKLETIFKIALIVLTFIFYYNAIFNHFSMDDYHVNINNPQTAKGFAGIPEIFTSLYAEESGMAYGYRPMVRTSFAIEYQFTAGLDANPYISHFINILLYAIAVLLLYKILRRLLRGYNLWFPFLVALLFMAHPTHTEVVASLKNRDVLLNFIFSFLAIWQFVRWVDTEKMKHLIFGMLSFIFALLSKESAIAQLAVFPLILYFFTDIKLKKLGIFTAIAVGIVLLVFIARNLLLPDTVRELMYWENPLVLANSFMLTISTGLYVIGFYLKLLIFPYPLLYYYGYNMLPVVGWSNPWVLVSLVVNIAMLVYAILKIKEKNILSFAILYFFVNISMYANIVAPVPGIVADRFVFFATISMAIFIVWLFFKIIGIPLLKSNKNNGRMIWVALMITLIIAPFGYYVHARNTQWRTEYSLYSADMPKLWNSVKANNLYAHVLMKKVNHELAKPVNPYKFIVGMIDKSEKHYQQVVQLDSTHATAWNNLGIIYSKIHGNQAKLRIKSHQKYNRPEKIAQEKLSYSKYFNTATQYFQNAIYYNPELGSAYFNLANSYELQGNYDSSVIYFQKAIDADGGELVSMSRLANAYFLNNKPAKAVDQNKRIISTYPESDMPFINMGNYAFKANDTADAIIYYKKAVELGTKPAVGQLLNKYYKSIGDNKMADYYLRKSQEAEQLLRKKKK
ncbi:MAG: tetratricopeptide repeat protein [Bacteroidota bacterium]